MASLRSLPASPALSVLCLLWPTESFLLSLSDVLCYTGSSFCSHLIASLQNKINSTISCLFWVSLFLSTIGENVITWLSVDSISNEVLIPGPSGLISTLVIPFWLPCSSSHRLFQNFLTFVVNTASPASGPGWLCPESHRKPRILSGVISLNCPLLYLKVYLHLTCPFFSFPFRLQESLLFPHGNSTHLYCSSRTVLGSFPIHLLPPLCLQSLTLHLPVSLPANRCIWIGQSGLANHFP